MNVQEQLDAVVSLFCTALKSNLIGIYLHGSLAMGCFNPRCSDLDLLVLTRRTLSPRGRSTVARALLSLSRSPAPIELSVISWADLHPWRHPCSYDFHFSEAWRGDFERSLADPACHLSKPESGDPDLAGHITVLHARGKVLFGSPSHEVFPKIPRMHFLDSILSDVLSSEFGLSSEIVSPVYMVLNVCRTLAYLQTGRILSKVEGGEWALTNIPEQHRAIVEIVLSIYRSDGKDQSFSVDGLQAFRQWGGEALHSFVANS